MSGKVEQVKIDSVFYFNHTNDIQVDCEVPQWNRNREHVFVPCATAEYVKICSTCKITYTCISKNMGATVEQVEIEKHKFLTI